MDHGDRNPLRGLFGILAPVLVAILVAKARGIGPFRPPLRYGVTCANHVGLAITEGWRFDASNRGAVVSAGGIEQCDTTIFNEKTNHSAHLSILEASAVPQLSADINDADLLARAWDLVGLTFGNEQTLLRCTPLGQGLVGCSADSKRGMFLYHVLVKSGVLVVARYALSGPAPTLPADALAVTLGLRPELRPH